MDTDLNTDNSPDTRSVSENGSMSSDSEADSSTSLDHSHSEFRHGKAHFHHPLESRYSQTNSENLRGDTQGSISHGTSDDSDSISTISTVSINVRSFSDWYKNVNDNSTLDILDSDGEALVGMLRSARGVQWTGDADNEVIFGTSWNDFLYGDAGNDQMYGFEGDDLIEGGTGRNGLFGNAGDDLIFLGTQPTTLGAGSFVGGTGFDFD